MKLQKNFFNRNPEIVAKELLGKVLIRKINNKKFRANIVETEAYFGEDDPASWARFGRRRDNFVMWGSPGTILIKNVHKYHMLNFVTEKKDHASAVLIRALKPLNFNLKCTGPGLLTQSLEISKEFNNKSLFESKNLFLEEGEKINKKDILSSFRIGVKNDLPKKLRFYIK